MNDYGWIDLFVFWGFVAVCVGLIVGSFFGLWTYDNEGPDEPYIP